MVSLAETLGIHGFLKRNWDSSYAAFTAFLARYNVIDIHVHIDIQSYTYILSGLSYTTQHVFGFVASHSGFTTTGVVAASQKQRVLFSRMALTRMELFAVKKEGVGQQDKHMFRNKHVDFGKKGAESQ